MKKSFLKILSVSALSLVLMACSSKTEKAPKFLQSNDIESSDWQVFEEIEGLTSASLRLSICMLTAFLMKAMHGAWQSLLSIIIRRYHAIMVKPHLAMVKPGPNSLIRIASITKLMTSEILIKLEQDKKLLITDPLQQYAYHGVNVPDNASGQPIRLYHLASHTSGLPREQPGGKWGRPVFIWPTQDNRWTWLKTGKLDATPGTEASYSNLAYDLLADAMVKASGVSYPQLFNHYVTSPAKMTNTTYTPNNAQCARLMEGTKPSPCHNTLAATGSGGVYSTCRYAKMDAAIFIDRQ